MIRTIRSDQRYHFENEWLNTYWHFSFDHYHDPANMNFGPLRVFNDDVIAPAGGFPTHGHREMEIITYIIDGALEHHDDMGNTGIIRPGEIQRMSAGTGVRHSEFNHSKKEPVHLVQLWILPARKGLEPSWEQKSFSLAGRAGKLLPVVTPAGESSDSAVQIHQDATIYTSLLGPGQSVNHPLAEGRRAYLFMIGGRLNLDGATLGAGDQARVTDQRVLHFSAAPGPNDSPADFLLLDLP
jgi:quercetin 2,3-dioxygenase